MTAQLQIPMPPQKRPHRAEGDAVYEAVMALRRRGFNVYRCGGRHKVGSGIHGTHRATGVMLDRHELLKWAAQYGWPREDRAP